MLVSSNEQTCGDCVVDVIVSHHRLRREGDGFKIAMGALDGARLSVGSCSVGAAHACFEIALNYVKVSYYF